MSVVEVSRFIIIGMQRSGTTATDQCLSHHPEVSCATDEVLVDPFLTRGLAIFTTRGRATFARRQLGAIRLFDAMTADPAKDVACRGIKIALTRYEEALDCVAAVREYFPGIKVILVQRDDLVAQLGSLTRARSTGQWHQFGGDRSSGGTEQLSIDREELQDYVENAMRIRAVLGTLESSHEVLRIAYERDIQPGLDHEKLFRFVGVAAVQPTWFNMTKVAPSPETFIAQYDKLTQDAQSVAASVKVDVESDLLERIRRTCGNEESSFLVDRALARFAAGAHGAAGVDLDELVKRASTLEPWISGRAHALGEMLGRGDAALQPLVADQTNAARWRANRALAFAQNGEPAVALQHYAAALDLAEDGAEKWWLQSMLGSARALVDSGHNGDSGLAGQSLGSLVLQCVFLTAQRDQVAFEPALERLRGLQPGIAAWFAELR